MSILKLSARRELWGRRCPSSHEGHYACYTSYGSECTDNIHLVTSTTLAEHKFDCLRKRDRCFNDERKLLFIEPLLQV